MRERRSQSRGNRHAVAYAMLRLAQRLANGIPCPTLNRLTVWVRALDESVPYRLPGKNLAIPDGEFGFLIPPCAQGRLALHRNGTGQDLLHCPTQDVLHSSDHGLRHIATFIWQFDEELIMDESDYPEPLFD
jgi:hypothetical protein